MFAWHRNICLAFVVSLVLPVAAYAQSAPNGSELTLGDMWPSASDQGTMTSAAFAATEDGTSSGDMWPAGKIQLETSGQEMPKWAAVNTPGRGCTDGRAPD
jgi:hypothetical protein